MKVPLSKTKRLDLVKNCVRYRFPSLGGLIRWSNQYPELFEHPDNAMLRGIRLAAATEANRLLSLSDAGLIGEFQYLRKKSSENEAVIVAGFQKIKEAEAETDNNASLGKKFRVGRKPGTGGPIRKAITNLLKKQRELKNPDLWTKLAEKPPRGWDFRDTSSMGKYIEGPSQKPGMEYRRFCNICGEERKKLRG